MRCTKFFYQTKVVTNQNLQLLCYVTFFDILHHYGVIAASLTTFAEGSLHVKKCKELFKNPDLYPLRGHFFIYFFFVGQCEVFVFDFVYAFFPWPRSS